MKLNLKILIILVMITNCCLFLVGCNSSKDITENQEEYKEDLKISLEEAKILAENALTSNFKDNGFDIIYDTEVEVNDYSIFYNGKYYRFLIEDEYIALESALLVNEESGVVTVCYPDNSVFEVREDESFILEEPMWQGNYARKLTEEQIEGNCFTLVSFVEYEDFVRVKVQAYYGHGGLSMNFDADLIEDNIAVYSNGDTEIKFELNSDNFITSTVIKGSEDVIEALDGILQ